MTDTETHNEAPSLARACYSEVYAVTNGNALAARTASNHVEPLETFLLETMAKVEADKALWEIDWADWLAKARALAGGAAS